MINPINYVYNGNVANTNHSNLNTISETTAKHMPNGLLRVPLIEDSKNNNHTFVDNKKRRQMYTRMLAPSIGSFTESFLKSKALLSPIYRNNEAIAKYEAISSAPVNFKRIKKTLDRII